jgi:hypothetical protein
MKCDDYLKIGKVPNFFQCLAQGLPSSIVRTVTYMFGEYDRPSSHSRVQAYLFGRSTKSLFHMITESRGREWGARIFIRNRTSYRATKDEMKSEHEAGERNI